MLVLLLSISFGVLVYIYGGYLLALKLIVWIRGARPIQRAPITPPLTLIISAYNEAAVIRKKIENALSLDYPADRREIVVISDASDDGTDDTVKQYASQGVRLFRQAERRGKTAGLNAALPTVGGEIVVFSDANAMYREDALRMLVRNFADANVGCVTGEARYLPGRDVADIGERLYWSYEMQIKRLETALGSMVGGDGAIYAIRKSLWRSLPENAINDFLNPLQIVAAGWRAIYEPAAVCFEETAGGTRAEYRRRVRIVSRSWRAVFQSRGVLNPLRVGFFAWSLLSHKVLRWGSGLFGALAGLSAVGLCLEVAQRWPVAAVAFLLIAAALTISIPIVRRSVAMLGYFAVINIASIVGMTKGSIGYVSGVWTTSRSAIPQTRLAAAGITVPTGPLLLAGVCTAIVMVATLVPLDWQRMSTLIFWGSAAALAYVYLIYPALLALVRPVANKPVRKAPIEPTVCLFVPAHNEEAVIHAKLRNAIALDYPAHRLDIVVASDGSLDQTNDIVRRFAPRVRLLEFSQRRGKIAAINDGMRSVAADIVVFSDANTFLETDAVRALVRNFADPVVGAVSGDVALVGERADLGRSEDLYYIYERWLQQAESDIGSMIGADGALYAIRTELFVPPADDTILDDMAIPMAVVRAGRRVVFEAKARAYEQGSQTATEEFARKARVIAGAMQFMSRRQSWVPLRSPQAILGLTSHKGLRWLSPIFVVSTFVTSIPLAHVSGGYAAAAAMQGLLFVCGLAGCVPAIRHVGFVALAHYFCLVQAAAAVGFLRGLTGAQSVLWRRFERVAPAASVSST